MRKQRSWLSINPGRSVFMWILREPEMLKIGVDVE
jgi:hypothetical protein